MVTKDPIAKLTTYFTQTVLGLKRQKCFHVRPYQIIFRFGPVFRSSRERFRKIDQCKEGFDISRPDQAHIPQQNDPLL